jgi:hypothetical protein
MPTLEEIGNAFLAADKAGNTEDASYLAKEYKRISSESQPQAPLSAVGAAAERSHQARLAAENAPSAASYWITGMVTLAVVALILLRKLIQSRPWRAIPGAVRSTVKMKDKMAFDLSDEDGEWFAAAEEEITSGNVEKATWSRALVKAGGNEDKRKAEYILLRVKKLRMANS